MTKIKLIGFAKMDPERRRKLAIIGGKKFKPGSEKMREVANKRWHK